MSTTQRKRPLEIWKQEPGTKWPEEEKQNPTDLVLHCPFLCPLSHPSAPFELWQLSLGGTYWRHPGPAPPPQTQTESKTEKFQLLLSLLVSLNHSSATHADRLYHLSGLQKHLLQPQCLLPKSHYRNRGLLLESILHTPERTLQGRGDGLEGCDILLPGFSSWTITGTATPAPSSVEL